MFWIITENILDVVDFYTKFRMIYFQFIFEFSSFKKQNFF